MDAPGSEKSWRTEGIEPTYVMDDVLRPSESVHGWRLGGTFSLEVRYLAPIVAWCEFIPRRSKNETPMLASFHLHGLGASDGQFQVWKILDPGTDGQVLTEPVPRDRVRLYFDRSEYPSGGDAASPVLNALVAAAKERDEERDALDQRERREDPYIGMQEQISDVIWAHSEPEEREEGHRELRAMFDRLPREILTELATRLAYDYLDAADELHTLQALLEEAD